MTREQMQNLDKCLASNNYEVDITECRIYSKIYDKDIGYTQIINHHKQFRVCLYADKKRYFFQIGEIVAYLVGMFDNLEEPEKYIVTTIDKEKRPHLFNIECKRIADCGKDTRFKKQGGD